MNFKKLRVWKESLSLCTDIYKITQSFPQNERFNLTSQITRSAVSVSSNIAEGHGRQSDKEFNRFCNISRGSLNELETQICIALELKYITKETAVNISNKINCIMGQLCNLQKKLLAQNS